MNLSSQLRVVGGRESLQHRIRNLQQSILVSFREELQSRDLRLHVVEKLRQLRQRERVVDVLEEGQRVVREVLAVANQIVADFSQVEVDLDQLEGVLVEDVAVLGGWLDREIRTIFECQYSRQWWRNV